MVQDFQALPQNEGHGVNADNGSGLKQQNSDSSTRRREVGDYNSGRGAEMDTAARCMMEGAHGRDEVPDFVQSNKIEYILSCQSLLSQFNSVQVRSDFVNGKFGNSLDPDILPKIDELRWTLCPRWQGGFLDVPGPSVRSARIAMEKLLSGSTDLAVLGMDNVLDPFSFKEWLSIIKKIATSQYWVNTPADQRCAHLDEEKPTANVSSGKPDLCGTNATKPKFKVDDASRYDPYETSYSGGRTKRSCYKPKKPIEEVVLVSSQSSSSESFSSSEGSTCSEFDQHEVRKRSLSGRKDNREVVTPPPFEMNGKMPLKDYLLTYEAYFRGKYRGNAYDMCQQLEPFLKGDLLNVYSICGGRQLKYSKMKERLLEYYKKQRIGGKRYWRKEFSSAMPDIEESLDLYGMKLLELAERAFPGSAKECASQLRQKFLENIPHAISAKILDAERAMKATSGGKHKYLKFSAIMQMAKDLQQEVPKQRSVMWSEPVKFQSKYDKGSSLLERSPVVQRTRQFNSRRSPQQYFEGQGTRPSQRQYQRQSRVPQEQPQKPAGGPPEKPGGAPPPRPSGAPPPKPGGAPPPAPTGAPPAPPPGAPPPCRTGCPQALPCPAARPCRAARAP